MNQEYIDKDGTVIILDEKGNRLIREHKDNIEKILTQENLIETLENKKDKIKNELKAKKVKEHYSPIYPFVSTTILFLLVNFYFIIIMLIKQENITISEIILEILNQTNLGNLVEISFFSLTFGLITHGDYNSYIEKKEQKNGLEKKLQKLEKRIEEEKEYLKSLNNEDNSNKTTITRVNDTNQIITELDKILDLYYKIGENEEEYKKIYEQQLLSKRLKGVYTPDEIEEIKKYFDEQRKEQGQEFIKRK